MIGKEVHNTSSNQLQVPNNNKNQLQASSSNKKWVINLSNTSLTPAQESLLAKGPNFAIAPQSSYVEYIAAIGSVCHKLTDQDVQEIRVDMNALLRRAKAPKSNLNKAERKTLIQLKRDKDRIILTVDKGVAMVVLDREDYIEKAGNLLAQPSYRTLDRDPTNKLKARLITILRRIKRATDMEEGMYKTMHPTCCNPQSFMVYLKSIKPVPPLGLLYPAGAQLLMGWPMS